MRPVSSELGLLYLDWVKSRMALADKLSGGKVGYIHLPDTSTAGNRMLQKLFYSQVGKPALIVDDRYNGGGFIPDRMIEYFTRRTLAYWARRGIESFTHARLRPRRAQGDAHQRLLGLGRRRAAVLLPRERPRARSSARAPGAASSASPATRR